MVGVSHAAPLHHFRDHQALLAAYVEQEWAALASRMRSRRAETSSDPIAALLAVGLVYIESGMRNPGLFGLLFRPDLRPDPDSPAFLQGAKAAHDELVTAVRECTGGSPQDPVLTELAWSVVHGFVELQWLLGVQEWEAKAVAVLETLRPVFMKPSPP
jgi:AcrR family transcriptional regulator